MRQRRQVSLWAALLFFITVLVMGSAWLYTTWRSSQTVLPPGLTINGMAVSGMTRNQALTAIEQAYTVPISVTYVGEPLPAVLPEVIELRVDIAATAENLDEAITTQTSAEAFFQYLDRRFRREEAERIEVNAVVLYSRERVDAFLERTAQKYDHPPLQPVPLPDAGTFRAAARGTELNIEASVPLLIDAILAADSVDRHVDLVVETEPAPEADITILTDAIAAALQEFGGVPGVFAKNLATGQELCINCRVAFSGLDMLKIGIVVEIYRAQELPLNSELAASIEAMRSEGGAEAANRLLGTINTTSPYSGAAQVTELLWSLGLESSYLAAPYGLPEAPPQPEIVTPANSRTDFATDPDPRTQTTPLEMGLLLENIYQCSRGSGSLRALFPRTLTPAECEEMLVWLGNSPADAPLGQALPPGTRIAHRHGWQEHTYADVAIVYGPQSDVVLSIFLYQPEWLAWEESEPTFSRIGELVYRFFNG